MASTAVMSSNGAVDLALLGLLAEGPRSGRELVGAVKVVGGDGFTPTSAFIEGRIADLVERGHLEEEGGWLHATPSGAAELARLLRQEIDPGATLRAFCTTLKLSLLDRVGADCRHEVIASLIGAGQRRARRLERARWAERGGSMMERCRALEQQRAAFELRWMQDVMAEGMGETLA
jgi:DNA-binding PadR family transcriptional regulator